MKYIVVCVSATLEDNGPDENSGIYQANVHSLTPCETTVEVACAIQVITDLAVGCDDNINWAVFEQVGQKMERRAVIFKTVGRTRVDCTFATEVGISPCTG